MSSKTLACALFGLWCATAPADGPKTAMWWIIRCDGGMHPLGMASLYPKAVSDFTFAPDVRPDEVAYVRKWLEWWHGCSHNSPSCEQPPLPCDEKPCDEEKGDKCVPVSALPTERRRPA